MKKFLMAALCSVASTVALAQIDSVFVEKFYVSNAADAAGSVGALPVGSVTWRFYVDLAPGHELQAVYGNSAHQLRFQTTTGFFNNEDRGATTANAIGASFLPSNTVYLDSYISVGAVGSNRLGVPKVEDNSTNNIAFTLLQNNTPSIGFPLTSRDGALATTSVVDAVTAVNISTELAVFDNVSNAGNLFQTTNGSWANLNGSEGPNATNRVLIAQITSDGILTYALNVQVRNTTTLQVYNYVASNPGAGEVTIAGLTGTLNQPNTLPTVSLTSPTNGASFFVGNSVTISANAADADGSVSQVEFLVDGTVVNTDNAAPYTYAWTATSGNHAITARATDNAGGQTTSSAVNITVGVVVPPTVSITAPANGSTFVLSATPVTISANAADADGTVSQVEFFVDGTSVGVDNASPYSVNWTATIGNKTLTAVATDNNNATATSASVNISVFDSASAYVVVSEVANCANSTFCLPIQALAPVNDVIGYDIVVNFDSTEVVPTGLVTVASNLINPVYTNVAYSIGTSSMNISVFLNGSAPANAEFNGTGRLLCVEFAKTSGFAAVDTSSFSATLQESYFNGVAPKVVSPGTYRTTQSGLFTSTLRFWSDNSVMPYNSANTSQYLVTNIYGNNGSCNSLSSTAVQPNTGGTFTYDIANGAKLDIRRDIANTTSVQSVVNGFDAFLTRRVLINDPSFIPSVYQIVAMDVNTDGVISAGDLSQINQRAVLALGEFRQDWNYTAGGVSNGQASKDWLFIDGTTLSTNAAYQISATYPLSDGIGYSKNNVPNVSFCQNVPSLSSNGCTSFGLETYTGILLGDVNGNYATASASATIRNGGSKLLFDLENAKVNGNNIDVPVLVRTDEAVNSVDFSMNYNSNKVSFNTVVNNGNNMEMVVGNTDALRVTSNSLDPYNTAAPVVYVRFNGSELTADDLSNVEAYINGERVTAEIGTGANTQPMTVSVYPNPASNVINIVASEDASYVLTDVQGKVIAAGAAVNAYENIRISTDMMANGVYVLKVYNSGSVNVSKISVKK